MKKNKLSLRLYALLIVCAFGFGCSSAKKNNQQTFNLRILHTGDIHSHLKPFNKYGTNCRPKDIKAENCYGGVARLKTLSDQLKAEYFGPSLFLDTGDIFQGSLFYVYFKGKAETKIIKHLGYDAITLGNHEFDDGIEKLKPYILGVNTPVVSSNVQFSEDSELQKYILPFWVKQLNGDKVGIIGSTLVMTKNMMPKPEPVEFHEVVKSVEEAVAHLQRIGVNKIIFLSHNGYQNDFDISSQVSGIDVILSGHSHVLLSNSSEEAVGPYPYVHKLENETTLIASVGENGKYLGQLDVEFDNKGRLVGWDGDTHLVTYDLQANKSIENIIGVYENEFSSIVKKPIGYTNSDLIADRSICRVSECNLGSLVADSFLEYGKKLGATIAIQNGGGLRNNITTGVITYGDAVDALPFSDYLVVYSLRGKDLLAALEIFLSKSEDYKQEGSGRFPQIAGAQIKFNSDNPPMQRIVEFKYKTSDGEYLVYESKRDSDKEFKIVSSEFVQRGKNGCTVCNEKAFNISAHGPTSTEIFVSYIKNNKDLIIENSYRVLDLKR